MMPKTPAMKDAMEAHTNLNVFASIQAILEGGCVYGGENKAAKQIIKICLAEQQRQLKLMDKALGD
jgi:hypothetical protein